MRIFGVLFLMWAPAVLAGEAKVVTLDSGVEVIQTKERAYYTGLKQKPAQYKGLGETHVMLDDCGNLPEEFDLRDLGVVGPVKDQGQCGSCWAFSQTASLESAHAASGKGNVLDLSEQEIVSCDTANYGCDGGMLNGFAYQISHGQSLERDFPYQASSGGCKDGLKPAAKAVDFANVGQADRKATPKEVQCALFKSHTVPWIVVAANGNWGSMPADSDGLYTQCSGGQVNHAIGVVGWKTVNGKVYFKVRNSWGPGWGSDAGRPNSEKGYAMMELGCDSLGEEVAYIITKKSMQCVPPLVKVPAEVTVARGDETRLAVRGETGVEYTWLKGNEKVGEGDSAVVSPGVDTVYKVVAKNGCGQAESSVRVKVMGF